MIRKFLAEINTVTWYRIAGVVIAILASKKMIFSVINWSNMKGWEAYFIAKAIVAGEGYSFPSTNRWLFDAVSDGAYHSTAWVDPFYTYCLAGFIWLFGDYHQLAVAIFNLFLYFSVFALTFYFVERLISSRAAVLAVLLLAISKFTALSSQMNNTFLAATFILLSAVVLLNYYKTPGYRRAIVLGLVLGLTALASPSAQFFIPITMITIIFWGWNQLKVTAVLHSMTVVLMAAVIMAPWVIRNYMVFDEFISVRNGGGQIVFVGTVAIAGTVSPEKIASNAKPAWAADTPRNAVWKSKLLKNHRSELERFQLEYAKEVGPDNWKIMDEVQRDKWFLKESKEFILANPIISLKLAMAKIEVFVKSMGWLGVGIILFAIIGAIATIKNPVLSTIVLWAASYIGPFTLVISYFSRYRAPIEPLLIILSICALYWLTNRFKLPKTINQ